MTHDVVSSPLLHIQKGLLVFLHDLPDTQRLDNVTVKIVVNMMQSFHLSMEGLGHQKPQSSTWFDCISCVAVSRLLFHMLLQCT